MVESESFAAKKEKTFRHLTKSYKLDIESSMASHINADWNSCPPQFFSFKFTCRYFRSFPIKPFLISVANELLKLKLPVVPKL